MNNFEKWQKENNENITLEQLAIKVSYRDCRLCPAFGSGYCEYPEFSCKDGLLRWAKKGDYQDEEIESKNK